MDQQIEMMMQWIGSEVCHADVACTDAPSPSEETLERLYRIAKAHDLAHLVGNALARHGQLPEASPWSQKFKKQIMLAVFRYEQIQAALTELCAALEEAKVPFLPLKGAVLRQYYPEPWMRTSCDIDILVREEDLARAKEWVVTRLSYREEGMDSHDVSLFSPSGVHLELHYGLVEDGIAQRSQSVLQYAWESSAPKAGTQYHYEMTDAMFYFYHIAHMAKHFENGGCGIRPFLDLWILNHRVSHDAEARRRLLEQGDLWTFATICRDMSEVWFSGGASNELLQRVERYVLSGGVYGTDVNKVSVHQGKKGGKLSYAMARIFLKYDSLKFHYPILLKHKWLLPVMEVRRWGKLIFCGGAKRSMRELKVNQSISREKKENTQAFIRQIGL